MGASSSISLVLLLLFAASIIGESSVTTTVSRLQAARSRWQVTIFNYQTSGPLFVHCKSKNDDLGVRKLQTPGERFNWEFRMNFWRTTLFWCSFRSGLGVASFEVFWPEKGNWLQERCNYENCVWYAKNDGLYLANLRAGTAELLHKWERPKA